MVGFVKLEAIHDTTGAPMSVYINTDHIVSVSGELSNNGMASVGLVNSPYIMHTTHTVSAVLEMIEAARVRLH